MIVFIFLLEPIWTLYILPVGPLEWAFYPHEYYILITYMQSSHLQKLSICLVTISHTPLPKTLAPPIGRYARRSLSFS